MIRPILGSSKTYSEQRKSRMQDAIDDYLTDDEVSSLETYDEMMSCIDGVINYHKQSLERAMALKSMMGGNNE
jgi:predicted house-cleaning noncanonical NTP pyrophosphatase (MazG superfamily)